MGNVVTDVAQRVLAGHLELVSEMNVTGGQKGVDAGTGRGLQGLVGDVDVLADAAAKACDAGSANLAGDALHGLEIALRGDGKAGFDDVDAEALKLAGHDQLFLGVHATAGGLLTVAQGGVKDENLFGWGSYVDVHLFTFDASATLVKLLFLQRA